MAATGGIGERYATQVGALWTGLARTLAQLERLAADPLGLDDEEALDSLKQLQYRLHVASEDAYTSERDLVKPILAAARPMDLFVVDRHYCTTDINVVGPLMFKAGMRRTTTTWTKATEADLAPWKLTLNQIKWPLIIAIFF